MTYYPSSAKYEREKLLRVMTKFHRVKEADLVEKMEQQENKSGYLKRLVREDIQRERDAQGKEKE